ncbi:MAG: S8 family peptidase [Bacteroidia bacterium]
MANRPHLKLNTQRQADAPTALRFHYGFGPEEAPDPTIIAQSLRQQAQAIQQQVAAFSLATRRRAAERSLEVPSHITNVRIEFHGQFNIISYFERWYNDFGLIAVSYSKFNTEVLFSVHDRDGFARFTESLDNFIRRELGEDQDATYDGKVRYVKKFTLLTTEDIIEIEQPENILICELLEFPLPERDFEIIRDSLYQYLDENGLVYRYSENTNTLEIQGATLEQGREIARNFDIIKCVVSSLATLVSPTKFNLPERGYGFEVAPPAENLPVIGILDTGVSIATPLRPIIINDTSFTITGTNPLEDNANMGSGHGTGVAALAALGKRAYRRNYRGPIEPDARILSLKILDNNSGSISQDKVVELMARAVAEQGVRIFVLTVCFTANKKENEDYSSYAYKLDLFAHENNCLIFISTSNNNDAQGHNTDYDPGYFNHAATNLSTPAESMNNITVGAAADCLKAGAFRGISPQKEFPALYTRKGHVNLSGFRRKKNSLYFKPDIIECGGDYEMDAWGIAIGINATMDVLSADPTESFYQQVGTSFSAPLASNIAAQVLGLYPTLRSQSIKALIVNGASLDNIKFPAPHGTMINRVAGYGMADQQASLVSSDDSITIILEDSIRPEEFKAYPINFPRYLFEGTHNRQRSLVTVTATLCFSFRPVLNNQLAYNPVHMAFSFFRNHQANEILAVTRDINSKLKSTLTWSQNGRNRANPIPYSNTQKIEFPVNLNELVDENGTFKLAINCRICPQLLESVRRLYDYEHNFSIAITIKNNLPGAQFTGRLYNELAAVNNLEDILTATAQGEALADIDNEA